jgi:hypothetical protein
MCASVSCPLRRTAQLALLSLFIFVLIFSFEIHPIYVIEGQYSQAADPCKGCFPTVPIGIEGSKSPVLLPVCIQKLTLVSNTPHIHTL